MEWYHFWKNGCFRKTYQEGQKLKDGFPVDRDQMLARFDEVIGIAEKTNQSATWTLRITKTV